MRTACKSLARPFLSVLCAGLCAGLLGACGGGGGGLDQAGATKATTAALTASAQVETQVQGAVKGGPAGGIKVDASAGHFTVSGTLSNPQGGSVDVQGQGTYAMDGSYSSTLSLTFTGWKDAAQNLVLSGKLNESVSLMISGTTTTVQSQYSGDLQVSGAVSGTASFDLMARTTTSQTGVCSTESGHVSGFSIDIKVGC